MKNYKCFAYEAAKRSHPYYDKALKNPPPREVIEKTWNDAVNDTANLWLSIFYRALGPEKALELYGIPAPAGEAGKIDESAEDCEHPSAHNGSTAEK